MPTVPGLDDSIQQLAGTEPGVVLALAVALLLGLRHATDPDHLTAVWTLTLADRAGGARGARMLGLAWGLGHATTLAVFGLPVILVSARIPAGIEHGAEVAVGALIVVLAVRLLVATRRARSRPATGGRSPTMAFGVGLVHGLAGSGAIALLVLGTMPDRATAAVALGVFALASTASMAVVSATVGGLLSRDAGARIAERALAALGAVSLLLGAWYAAVAI